MTETLGNMSGAKFAAGTNVDSSITYDEWVDLITSAEGVVCSETQTNWVDLYANLDADYRDILRVATESYAAVGAVQHNMNTYLSITEAQSIMDANVYRFERAMTKLKESDKRTFVKDGD